MYASGDVLQLPENIAKYHSFCKLVNHFYWAVFLHWTYFRTSGISILPKVVDLASLCIFFGVLACLEGGLTQSFSCALLKVGTALCGIDEDHFATLNNLFNQSIFKFEFSFITLLFFSFLLLKYDFGLLFKYLEKYHFFLFRIIFRHCTKNSAVHLPPHLVASHCDMANPCISTGAPLSKT